MSKKENKEKLRNMPGTTTPDDVDIHADYVDAKESQKESLKNGLLSFLKYTENKNND
jgi:hypothetical protein